MLEYYHGQQNIKCGLVWRMALTTIAIYAGLSGVSSIGGTIPLTGHRGYNLGTLDTGLLQGEYKSTGSSIARLHVRFDLDDSLSDVKSWLPLLKPAIKSLNEQGQVAVVSLHNPTKRVNSTRNNWINGTKFLEDWKALSSGLSGVGTSEGVWYDLWNEPPDTNQRQNLLQKTAKAIRDLNDERPIVVPSVGDRSSSVVDFQPLEDISNQILGVHLWDMKKLTHGWKSKWEVLPERRRNAISSKGKKAVEDAKNTMGTEWHSLTKKAKAELLANLGQDGVEIAKTKLVPDDSVRYNNNSRMRIESALQEVSKVADKFDLPVFIGELGMYADHPDASRYFNEVLGILEEDYSDFNVALHAWKEAYVWRYEDTEYSGVIDDFIASNPNADLVGENFLEWANNTKLFNGAIPEIVDLNLQPDLSARNDIANLAVTDLPMESIHTDETRVPEPSSAALLLLFSVLIFAGFSQRSLPKSTAD